MSRLIFAAAVSLALTGSAVAAEPVMPPEGATKILEVEGVGVQIYACEAKDGGFAWVFKSPEASLFDVDGRQAGVHGAGPSWKLMDGSAIVGEKAGEAAAPDGKSIAWLLLKVKSHDGKGLLADANWVRRAETVDGGAPKSGCSAEHVSETARMRYSAKYQFFR